MMMRIALAVVWGSILFTAGEAEACAAHAAQAAQAPKAAPAGPEARSGEDVKKPDTLEPHAARCQCGSAADCTCKKGTCECAKCKKPGREQAPIKAEAAAPSPSGAGV